MFHGVSSSFRIFSQTHFFLSGCYSKVWRSKEEFRHLQRSNRPKSPWILRLSFQANGWGSKSLSGGTDCCKWMFTFFPQQLLLFVPGLRFFCQVFTGGGTGLDLWLGDAFKILAAYGNCFFFKGNPSFLTEVLSRIRCQNFRGVTSSCLLGQLKLQRQRFWWPMIFVLCLDWAKLFSLIFSSLGPW